MMDTSPEPPLTLQATMVTIGQYEFVVFCLPSPQLPPPKHLSVAEREILPLLLAGRSNLDIARQRGTSRRTVANQVASILRKLGVSSRVHLAAALARS